MFAQCVTAAKRSSYATCSEFDLMVFSVVKPGMRLCYHGTIQCAFAYDCVSIASLANTFDAMTNKTGILVDN